MIVRAERNGKVKRSGFSLIEIALSLMLVAVGMLAVLGLFPAGLDASRAARNERAAAAFAENTFNAYRIPAEDFAGTNWAERVPVAPSIASVDLSEGDPWPPAAPSELTQDFDGLRLYRFYVCSAGGVADAELRYKLQFELSRSAGQPHRLHLWIWPGRFSLPARERAMYFHTEFSPQLYGFGQ